MFHFLLQWGMSCNWYVIIVECFGCVHHQSDGRICSCVPLAVVCTSVCHLQSYVLQLKYATTGDGSS